MSSSYTTASSKNNAKPLIKLLKEDHKKVKTLFAEFEALHDKKMQMTKRRKLLIKFVEN